jgi:hypothetical protein
MGIKNGETNLLDMIQSHGQELDHHKPNMCMKVICKNWTGDISIVDSI